MNLSDLISVQPMMAPLSDEEKKLIDQVCKELLADIDREMKSGLNDCKCSTRDLLWVGHKCGRKAPIDK